MAEETDDKTFLEKIKDIMIAHTEQLKAGGVAKIEADFSGSGDEGSLDEIRYLTSTGEAAPFDAPEELREAILNLDDGLGYDGEGGGLDAVFDVETGKLTLNEFYYSTERTYEKPFEV